MDDTTNLVDLVIGPSEDRSFDWSKMPSSAAVQKMRGETTAVYHQHPLSEFSTEERAAMVLNTRQDELPRLMAYREMMHKSADGQSLGVPVSVVDGVIRADTALSGYELVEDTLTDTVFTLLGLVGARLGRFNEACRGFVARERPATEKVSVDSRFAIPLRFLKQNQAKALDKVQKGKSKKRRDQEEVAAAAERIKEVAAADAVRLMAKEQAPTKLLKAKANKTKKEKKDG